MTVAAQTGGALSALLKKAAKAPATKKPATDDDAQDRKDARLAAIREFRNAKSDEDAAEAFEALMESSR